MDLKRLLSKKVLLAGLLIYLFQVLAFFGSQINYTVDEDFWKQNRQYRQYVEEIKGMPVQDALNTAQELLAADRNTVTLALSKKMLYLAEYENSIERILVNAKNVKKCSVFQNPDSFAYVNAVKTAGDFEKMRGILLLPDQDRATQKVLEFSYLPFFVAAFMIYVMYEILRERDNGMWEITHVLKNGRCRLAAGRGIGLAIITVVFYMLCIISNLLISCFIYGFDDFGGYIQTIQDYAKYPLPQSKIVYLGIFASKSCLALVAVVLLLYMIFTLIPNRNLAAVVILSGLMGEWRLMSKITVHSNMNLLRYINIMQVFNIKALDCEYQNLNLFGTAVSAYQYFFISEIFLLIVCFGLTIWLYGKMYPIKKVWFKRRLKPVKHMEQKLLEWMPLGLKEAYKIMISKRCLIYAILGAIVCIFIYNRTLVIFPETQQRIDLAYDSYGGSDWTAFDSYVEELENQYGRLSRKAQEMTEQIKAGTLGTEKIDEVMTLNMQADSYFLYLEEYHGKQKLHQRLQSEKGIEIYAMSDRGYCEMIGPNSILREIVIGIVLLLIIVLCASQTFGIESRAYTKPLIKSSGNGIAWLWKMKMICITVIIAGMLVCFLGIDYVMLINRYHAPYLNAPIQSLSFFTKNMAHISILQFIVLNIVFKVIIMICAASSVLLISSDAKVTNYMYVPVLIIMYGIIYIAIILYGQVWLMLATVITGVFVTGICVACSYRKWCT